jgi:hypothetical protein
MGGEREIGDLLAEIKVRAERVGMRTSASLFYSGKRSSGSSADSISTGGE